MNKHENAALLHILGSLDGHLEPRPLEDSSFQADWQEQAHYASGGGLAVPAQGDDAAGKKQWQRSLAGLERQGLIVRAGKEIALTTDGHATARRLAGLPGEVEALDLLAAVATCPTRWTGGWASEPSLAGLPPCPSAKEGCCRIPGERLGLLLATADALVLAGLITWRPFKMGGDFCLYAATRAGHQRAGDGDAARWFRRVEAARVNPLAEDYALAFEAAYRARESARPRWPNRCGHLDPIDPPRAVG
jgi:hypothetical protein